MKKYIFLSLALSLTAHAQDHRQEQHEAAVEAFKNLNFFYKGRGMAISPDMIKTYETMSKLGIGTGSNGMLYQRWGMLVDDNKIRGLFNEPYEGMQVGVMGCVACHSGKAAGQYIVGLGNKNIDVGQVGADAALAMKMWGAIPHRNPKFKEMHERAVEFTKGLGDPAITNETQGLVSTGLIRSWFYKVQSTPLPADYKKGVVKVPHLWGYGEKRKTGSFWDGEGNGVLGGWGIAVELYAGQTPENVREYFDKVHTAEDYLGEFLSPNYPFKVDMARATRGEEVYKTTCMGCHGEHQRDLQGHPIFVSPKHIPLRVVKTDSERLDALTDEMYDMISRNPLNDVIQFWKKPEHGYVAPKLWGIWSRFPYLHNASVPTIHDLISPPESRPKKFSLKSAGERERFDETKLGLTKVSTVDLISRRVYDTSKTGQSNQGHYFESFKKLTEENKSDLIEYLKTL